MAKRDGHLVETFGNMQLSIPKIASALSEITIDDSETVATVSRL
jgi:hypothetical protein